MQINSVNDTPPPCTQVLPSSLQILQCMPSHITPESQPDAYASYFSGHSEFAYMLRPTPRLDSIEPLSPGFSLS